MISSPSSTPSNGIGSLWQLGLSIDQTGVMAADASKLDTALSNNFDDVVKMFTGNQNNLAATSTTPGGIAGDAFKKLTSLLSNTGPMSSSSAAATSRNSKYQDDLTKLGTRMDALLARYQKQFASMNSIVGNVNSQKTSLKSTFDGMMASYTGKN
jgi:flagellar hook-associated protein 2